MVLQDDWRGNVERERALEPTTLLHTSDTCVAFTTESGILYVAWPGRGGEPDDDEEAGTRHVEGWEGATCEWDGVSVMISMPVVLVGDVSLQPHDGAIGIVIRHVCPETCTTSLGPWDEHTARALLVALREGLHLPRTLGAAPNAPTPDELVQHPRRYHGALIVIEGRWSPAFEAPSFVGRSTLVFPPDVAKPDRATRVRAEGIWIVTARRGWSTGGSAAELRARTVEALPWASTLPEGHRRALGLPLPERLLELVDRGAWKPGIVHDMSLLSATGWARVLDWFLSPAEIEAEAQRLRAMGAAEKQRLGLAMDAPRCLDEDRALILATNADGRMIALDYRRDPPEVMRTEEARGGELRWRRLAGDFDAFAEGFLLVEDEAGG